MAIKLANPLDHTSVQLCFAFHRQAVVISGLTKDSQQSKDVEERDISTGPCKSRVSGHCNALMCIRATNFPVMKGNVSILTSVDTL